MCEVLAAYNDALKVKLKKRGCKHLSVGKTLNNIGSINFKNRNHNDALKAYEEARRIIVANLGPTHLDVATVYSNIGDVYLSMKNLELARENYTESLNIRWSRMGQTHSKVIRLLEKIAAIEMADAPRKLRRQKVFDSSDDQSKYYKDGINDLRELGNEVKNDLCYVEKMTRNIALDMIRDKEKIIQEMTRL
mmetsp:Transcript_30358/g.33674  ORF Transcript_30358/g.33674 Transcript_30358/m.33674 type:complete len:192 (-) Transcript_30358:134-709(-)|eukprot:CAMPEP_0194131620 /NCGR_PEP_ID=MMETSP0152-20130528/2356_1 /TAXON_ID=1049557 /ORGANISM="Thalassiothrix antarctica, Strain L6-D1" /LENGTH=191 /DNA_ID=CAMNT_0038826465 /DNA_START=180 /DNA_END=755 /DNA_ORIENTATION=-